MPTISKLNVMLTGNASGFVAMTKEASKHTAGLHDGLHKLKKQFGRGSTLFEIGHLLEGKGPLIGITLMLNALEELGKKAVELNTQFALGKISAAEMADEIAKEIPLFGKLYSFGRSIRELIDGEKAHAEIMAESIKEAEEKIKAAQEYLEIVKKLETTVNNLEQQLHPETAVLNRLFGQSFELEGQQRVTEVAGIMRKLGAVIHAGLNEVEEVPAGLHEKFGAELTKLADQKKKISDAIVALEEAAQPRTVPGPSGGGAFGNTGSPDVLLPPDAAAVARLAAKRKELAELDKQADHVRDQMAKLDELMRNVIGRKALTEGLTIIGEEFKKLGESAGEAFKTWGERALEAGKQTEEANSKISDLEKEIRQLHMTEGEKLADDLSLASASQREQAKGLADQLDAMKELDKAQKELAESGKRIWEETRTPLEKYEDQLDKLGELFASGNLDVQTFGRGILKAQDELDKSERLRRPPTFQAPHALARGSSEAAAFLAQNEAQQKGESDPQRQLVNGQKRGNVLLKTIADEVAKIATGGLATALFN